MPVWVNEAAAISSACAPATRSSCPSAGSVSTPSSPGIWRDYEHQSGAIVIGSADYVRLTGDHRHQYRVAVAAAERAPPTTLENAIRDLLPATRVRPAHAAGAAPPVAAGIRSHVRDHLSARARRGADRTVRHRRGHQRAGAGAARRIRRAAAPRIHARADRGDAGDRRRRAWRASACSSACSPAAS